MTVRAERTRAEGVFARLREDILTGVLAPGSKLSFASLEERYGASVGVTREALSRLSELGLVTSEPQVGYRVPAVSAADLADLTLARCEIECAALVQSVTHGDVRWETDVVATHYMLERTPVWSESNPEAVNPDWAVEHVKFHAALIAACPSKRLIEIAASLRDANQIYWSWSAGVTMDAERRDFEKEHRAIKDAALARNAQEASDQLRSHMCRTADILMEHLKKTGLADAAP
jgi:DNA-binding GntR family transcriptional regulator